MPLRTRLVFASACGLLAAAGSAVAQPAGWSTSYNMGTLAAGVANADGGRMTFYCGDGAAARANPAIRGGPYLEVSLPETAGLEKVASIEVVVDGKPTSIPVTAQADGARVSLNWTPGHSFGLARMKMVVIGLRKAKSVEIRAGGRITRFPTEGVAKALADDPLGCK
jgi:hypothetical protein